MSDTFVMSGQHLTYFRPVTQDELCVIIMKSPSKSCEPNPIPKKSAEKSDRMSAPSDHHNHKQITG